MIKEKQLTISFASVAEGQKLIQGNTNFYNNLTQCDLDWRVRKEGATIQELMNLAQANILDFTENERDFLTNIVTDIEENFSALECHLPINMDIIFVKSTMSDEGCATGYTTKNSIFLNADILTKCMPKRTCSEEENTHNLKFFRFFIAHELFHCLTRCSPKFRKEMYNLIGFTILDKDIELPEAVRNRMMSNPDVEHLDNYAEFTINGIKRKCALAPFYEMTWSEASTDSTASFFGYITPMLLPLDNLDTPLPLYEASDFWKKVGENTEYVSAPEECLADNFAYAVTSGQYWMKFKSAWLIFGIMDLLRRC